MVRHRRAVLGAWAIVLLVCAALLPSLKGVLSAPYYGVEKSQSQKVEQLLDSSRLRGAGSEQDVIVFYAPGRRVGDPVYRRVVARVLRLARMQAGVEDVSDPYARAGATGRLSADGHAAIAPLALAGGARSRFVHGGQLEDAIVRASGAGVHAWLTGFSSLAKDLAQVQAADVERAEAIGVPIALLVLIAAVGTLAAAVLPLILAGAALLTTFGVIYVLASLLSFDVFLLTIVTMIGIGIGIDYSLFIVSRFREELARSPRSLRSERRRVAEAVGAAVATSGRTIFYSGIIVGLSLTSLFVIRLPAFREFAIGTLVSVLCTLLAALTLLPALLGQLGRRIDAGLLPARLQPPYARGSAAEGRTGWARWAVAMMRRPLAVSLVIALLLGAAIVPVFNLRYGVSLDLPSLVGTPSGNGSQILARSFSPGMMSPLQIVVWGGSHSRHSVHSRRSVHSGPRVPSRATLAAVRTLERDLRGDRRVDGVAGLAYGPYVLVSALPATSVDSRASQALVRRLRTAVAPAIRARDGVSVLVGGWVAQSFDGSAEITAKLPVVVGITLAMAFVFLLVMLRSLVLPVKAIIMNLLSTGATLGLLVLVFQNGHGEHLLGFSSVGFIQIVLPLTMFVLLFGLSMDYEVFLVRRMQETWRQTADNRRAVAAGIEHTGRPITAAAAIMVAVYCSFLTADNLEVKQYGFGLGVAIALDATVIRMMLVPALMSLLGGRNWWLPARLDRMLGRVGLD